MRMHLATFSEMSQLRAAAIPSEAGLPARRASGWLLGLCGLLLLGACGGQEAKAPNPMRPLDERRAIKIITSTFHEEHVAPVQGRQVEIDEGTVLELDVGAQGQLFGVAYTTPQERQSLGAALPPRDAAMGDALQLLRGLGDDEEARILVLRDQDYVYDDHVGTEHEQTTITAENQLRRDVRDFLVRARAEKWP